MAAKSEFSKNHKKIRFVDISEILPERYITGHKETIESLKNWVNFPESCPLRIAMLPKIRGKCPWGSQFGGLYRKLR